MLKNINLTEDNISKLEYSLGMDEAYFRKDLGGQNMSGYGQKLGKALVERPAFGARGAFKYEVPVIVNGKTNIMKIQGKGPLGIDKIVISVGEKVIFFIRGERIEAAVRQEDEFDIEKGVYLIISKLAIAGTDFRMTNTQFHKIIKELKRITFKVLVG